MGLLLMTVALFSKDMKFRLIGCGQAYYTDYENYHFEEPVQGLHLDLELFNLVYNYGVGGSAFFSLKSWDDRFNSYQFYDVYLHNYYAFTSEKRYFIYGFIGGFRNTKMEYIHYESELEKNLEMYRPLLGFHFSTEKWGMKTYWTQAENRKPVLGYELKFRSNIGLVAFIGRTNRGPITKADSEFYLRLGYEFFR